MKIGGCSSLKPVLAVVALVASSEQQAVGGRGAVTWRDVARGGR
eukprot:COSAG02_NODE_3264_length_7066_cov_91.385101_6_plen_44_part_00